MNFDKVGCSCEKFVDLIIDFVDDNLDPDERAKFEKHRIACPNCVTFLDNYQQSIKAIGSLKDEESADVPEQLVKAVLTKSEET